MPFPKLPDLPVSETLPALEGALRAGRDAILVSPPGSGKTTLLPLALLRDLPGLLPAGQRILLLEPRRMAARAAAWRMADLLGEDVGETVGYRMRLERRESPRTRILVLTEGLLARMVQSDPMLSDAAMVIFDEFHERSLHADFGLTLCRDIQREVRPEMRLLILSATLDTQVLLASLDPDGSGHWASVASEGRLFPVETQFLPPPPGERLWDATARAVRHALSSGAGGVLAFLPGEGEIRRTVQALGEARPPLPDSIRIHPLYAALSRSEQDAALAPSPPGTRKVVLATSIAESSLTIDGIDTVVDAGWMRVSRFSPVTGMERLETLRITRDRADQRRGRAGRLRPGLCLRLWDKAQDDHLLPAATPEILSADLVPLRLALADIGYASADTLPWVTPPPGTMLAQAETLLVSLGAIDERHRITEHGRRMAALSFHPRLAHALLEAAAADIDIHRPALLAALLAEGVAAEDDRGFRVADADSLVDAVEFPGGAIRIPAARRDRIREMAKDVSRTLKRGGKPSTVNCKPQTANCELQTANCKLQTANCELRTANAPPVSPWPLHPLASFVATAYPDRVARRRTGETGLRYLLSGGRGGTLRADDPLAREEWLAVADLDGGGADAAIRLAVPFGEDAARALLPHLITTRRVFGWDARRHAVAAIERETLGAIVLRERPLRDLDPDAVGRCLCEGVRAEGLDALGLSEGVQQLRARVALLRATFPDADWPDLSDTVLLDRLEDWLLPRLPGCRKLEDVRALDLFNAIQDGFLTPAQRRELPRLAPTHVVVPSGSRLALDYAQGTQPVLAVRIQEVFGMASSPRVADGRVPVLMHLLSPARRPVQVTSDLASFWANGYAEVRKDLRGRYPKHDWPEDPARAVPHRGVRPH